MAWIRKANQVANGAVDFLAHTARGLRIIGRDMFPNLGDVLVRLGMKAESRFGGLA
jgi:hypothetical protein